MPRSYRLISNYENEILELRKQGLSKREIKIKPKERPRKNGTNLPLSIEQLSKLTQLQYELDKK